MRAQIDRTRQIAGNVCREYSPRRKQSSRSGRQRITPEIQQIADRVGVIADGRIVLEEEAEIIRKNHPQDMEDYLLAAIEGGIHLD